MVHHRHQAGQTTRIFATLCRACHAKVHHVRHLKYGRLTPYLEQLWYEQHQRQAQQLLLPAFEPAAISDVQVTLF